MEEGFQFDLWSDSDGRTLALTYGAADDVGQSYADRLTVLLDGDGVLLLEYINPSVASNPQDVLDDCQVLFGS